MAVIPTIQTNANPVVIATAGTSIVTYNEIVQSQGVFVYKAKSLYLRGQNINDFSGGLSYYRNTPDGQIYLFYSEDITVMPNQFYPSFQIDYEEENEEVIFDGFTTVQYTIPANTTVQFFYTVDFYRRSEIMKQKYGNK